MYEVLFVFSSSSKLMLGYSLFCGFKTFQSAECVPISDTMRDTNYYIRRTAKDTLLLLTSKGEESMMEETVSENGSEGWKRFLKKHSAMFALFVVTVVLVAVWAVYVFLWFVGDAQSIGMVPSTLGLWTMGHFVTFILHLIFWELLLVGIPVVLAAVAGWMWWRKLPVEEKREYRFFGKRSRATSGGGGASVLFFIAFCIKVYIDGYWNVAIASWTFNYVVYSMVWILVWVAVIFGIPLALGAIWWISREMRKKP
jgi:hypothetical protein